MSCLDIVRTIFFVEKLSVGDHQLLSFANFASIVSLRIGHIVTYHDETAHHYFIFVFSNQIDGPKVKFKIMNVPPYILWKKASYNFLKLLKRSSSASRKFCPDHYSAVEGSMEVNRDLGL